VIGYLIIAVHNIVPLGALRRTQGCRRLQ